MRHRAVTIGAGLAALVLLVAACVVGVREPCTPCETSGACGDGFRCTNGFCEPTDGTYTCGTGTTKEPQPRECPACADAGTCPETRPCPDSGTCADAGGCPEQKPCPEASCADAGTCPEQACADAGTCPEVNCPECRSCGDAGTCPELSCVECGGCDAGTCPEQQSCPDCGLTPDFGKACQQDTDCATGELCVSKRCLKAQCVADTDCSQGRVCKQFMCVIECATDGDCVGGRICITGSCKSPQCASAGDCTGGKVCRKGRCVLCTVDADCPSGKMCEQGKCVNAECASAVDCAGKGHNGYPTSCSAGRCKGCTADKECGSDRVCEVGNCVLGIRCPWTKQGNNFVYDDASCGYPAKRMICEAGRCTDGCRKNSDCPVSASQCVLSRCVKDCSSNPKICDTTNADRTKRQLCFNGGCVTEMVYVPPGTFTMGSDSSADPNASTDETPQQKVFVSGFFIDRFEVTNAQYNQCVGAGVCKTQKFAADPAYSGTTKPVVGVDWYDAVIYSTWVGARLPTEAEWEKAARGIDGRIYPWGSGPPTSKTGNLCDINCTAGTRDSSISDGEPRAAPVGSYLDGVSPYGALDMAGNAWEWVANWYSLYSGAGTKDPTGPATGTKKVFRGGSWGFLRDKLRCAGRVPDTPERKYADTGFRTVRSAR